MLQQLATKQPEIAALPKGNVAEAELELSTTPTKQQFEQMMSKQDRSADDSNQAIKTRSQSSTPSTPMQRSSDASEAQNVVDNNSASDNKISEKEQTETKTEKVAPAVSDLEFIGTWFLPALFENNQSNQGDKTQSIATEALLNIGDGKTVKSEQWIDALRQQISKMFAGKNDKQPQNDVLKLIQTKLTELEQVNDSEEQMVLAESLRSLLDTLSFIGETVVNNQQGEHVILDKELLARLNPPPELPVVEQQSAVDNLSAKHSENALKAKETVDVGSAKDGVPKANSGPIAELASATQTIITDTISTSADTMKQENAQQQNTAVNSVLAKQDKASQTASVIVQQSPTVDSKEKVNAGDVDRDNHIQPITKLPLLPDPQLDDVLNNLAKRLNAAHPVITENQRADFVSHLKAGLAEIKQQLKQGHEPAIDLKALVSDALAKTTSEELSTKPQIQTQVQTQVARFVQSFEPGITLHNAVEQVGQSLLKLDATREAATLEQNNVNKSTTAFDRAVNITKPEGQQQLAEKVRWMLAGRLTQAEIRLDPPDLGGMQIKIAMQGEAATVNFVVQSQQARDVLDQAVPRLREMLAEKGIELGQSSVQQDHRQHQDQELANQSGGSHADGKHTGEPEEAEKETKMEQPITNGHVGAIDYFV